MGKRQAHTIVRISVALFAAAATIMAPQLASAAAPIEGDVPPSAVVKATDRQHEDGNKATNDSNTATTGTKGAANSDNTAAQTANDGNIASSDRNPSQKSTSSTKPSVPSQSAPKLSTPNTGITPKTATLNSPKPAPTQGARSSIGPQSDCTDNSQHDWGDNAYWQIDSSCTLHFGTKNPGQGKGTIENGFGTNTWDRSKVIKILIDSPVKAPVDSSYLFAYYTAVTSIDLTNLDTSGVTNMSHLFYYEHNNDNSSGDNELTSLNLGNDFDTSNVTNMAYMFVLFNVANIDLGNKFDTSNVTNMAHMFNDLGGWREDGVETNLDLGDKFDTSKVTNMEYMFCNITNASSLDLGSKFDTSKVEHMSGMFSYNPNLVTLNLHDKFDTGGILFPQYDQYYIFGGDTALRKIYLGTKTKLDFSSSRLFDYDVESGSKAWMSEDHSWHATFVTPYDEGTQAITMGPPTTPMWYGLVATQFDGNGATSGDVPESMLSGESFEVPTTSDLKKTGYVFNGWAETAEKGNNGEAKYPLGSSFTTPMEGDTVTLYASWRKIAVPTIDTITAPKSENGEPATGNVTVTGTTPEAVAGDTVTVSVTGSSDSKTVAVGTDAQHSWTAELPVSYFSLDTSGSGANYSFSAVLNTAEGPSSTVTKTQDIDMIAPAATGLTSESKKVTGKMMTAESGLSGITPTAESGDTVTVTWLDKDDAAIAAVPADTATSGSDGTFTFDWPSDRNAVKASVQAKDATGNTSAVSTVNLNRPVTPTIDAPHAPKMVGGKTPTDPVTISGDTSGATSGDSVDVRLLPEGKNADDAEAGQGTAATSDASKLDASANKWTAKFPVSAFGDDKTGTGAKYTFCARLHTSLNGNSAYTCAQYPVDITAPVATELAFTAPSGSTKGTVSGKVLSSADQSAQQNRTVETGVTLTFTWLDAKGQPFSAKDTETRSGAPLTTTATSEADGTFSVQWPQGVTKGDQVTVTAADTVGNTSAPLPLTLGQADTPGNDNNGDTSGGNTDHHDDNDNLPGNDSKKDSNSGKPDAKDTQNAASDKTNRKLSATGAATGTVLLAAIVTVLFGVALDIARKAEHRAQHAKQ
ncbi:BspA family leucine-rich repeat surface protein [Bifidobacterium sp. ESL0732]|uniref:BspA family leucine-rich repeat surface protein n=1 Tax=Bifidobacterium sp. ESL0732 TaxID=2983222 RepID=UPI0023F76C33|nr:BspA family leucine-rich repeat surface protein [Bifidobacterium sp. ESL0732]WEV64462.1 BspA family leucine-rich repeat surface protein [Bifidobacterium sp. ESL0732]